jgi:hypothetical protein
VLLGSGVLQTGKQNKTFGCSRDAGCHISPSPHALDISSRHTTRTGAQDCPNTCMQTMKVQMNQAAFLVLLLHPHNHS